jgi:serine/threonine-protein kinase
LVDAGRTDDGRLFLITELLLGTRLDRLLADRRPSVRETVRIMIQICGSLSEAHLNKIVHRDLKPSNVFIERVGRDEIVKVLDFGVAKLLDEPAITRPMTIVGTPGFMSPEQGAGKPLDGRSDLYALGAIAFECLAGRPPHVAEGKVALLVMQLSEPAPQLSTFVDAREVPADLCALVMRMLEHDPAKRPASADEVREELERIALRLSTGGAGASSSLESHQHSHDTTTELAAPSPMASSVASKRWLIVLLVVVPLLVLAIAAYLYLSNDLAPNTRPG